MRRDVRRRNPRQAATAWFPLVCLVLLFWVRTPGFGQAVSGVVPPLYASSGVSAEAVKQGQLGSCYFHASIAAIAHRHPDSLRLALHETGAGVYTVRFVDGGSETVQVEDAMFARNNRFDMSDGLWVSLLLRGLAQRTMRQSLVASLAASWLPASTKAGAEAILRSNDALLLAYDRAVRTTIYQDGRIDRDVLRTALNHQIQALQFPSLLSKPVLDFLDAQGFFETLARHIQANAELFGAYRAVGSGGVVMTVMTAFDAPAQNLPVRGPDELRALLSRMQQNGLPMVATSGPALDHSVLAQIRTREGGPDWWVPSHAYTVMSYNSGSGQVTMRNPWGRQPEPNGVFTLSIADFIAAFSYIDLPVR